MKHPARAGTCPKGQTVFAQGVWVRLFPGKREKCGVRDVLGWEGDAVAAASGAERLRRRSRQL